MLSCAITFDSEFQVNKYLENYERALTGYEAAALKDPGLKATEEVQKIVNLLDKIDNLLVMRFSVYCCITGSPICAFFLCVCVYLEDILGDR